MGETAPRTPADDEALFPSGPWVGFYTYSASAGRHRMELGLTFHQGRITGSGHDDIGPFLVAGAYDVKELEVTWWKTYPGSHRVWYRGFREGKGIWGTWEIPPAGKGGFKIWPKGVGGKEALEDEETAPAEAEELAPSEAEPSRGAVAPADPRR